MADVACAYCRVQSYYGVLYHAYDCVMVVDTTAAGVHTARVGQVCATCEDEIDSFSYIDDGMGGRLPVCLGCAAEVMLIDP